MRNIFYKNINFRIYRESFDRLNNIVQARKYSHLNILLNKIIDDYLNDYEQSKYDNFFLETKINNSIDNVLEFNRDKIFSDL